MKDWLGEVASMLNNECSLMSYAGYSYSWILEWTRWGYAKPFLWITYWAGIKTGTNFLQTNWTNSNRHWSMDFAVRAYFALIETLFMLSVCIKQRKICTATGKDIFQHTYRQKSSLFPRQLIEPAHNVGSKYFWSQIRQPKRPKIFMKNFS